MNTSWSRLCTVNHWVSASNYQLSNMKPPRPRSELMTSEVEGEHSNRYTTEPPTCPRIQGKLQAILSDILELHPVTQKSVRAGTLPVTHVIPTAVCNILMLSLFLFLSFGAVCRPPVFIHMKRIMAVPTTSAQKHRVTLTCVKMNQAETVIGSMVNVQRLWICRKVYKE